VIELKCFNSLRNSDKVLSKQGLDFYFLGSVDYKNSLEIQNEYVHNAQQVQQRDSNSVYCVMGLEHPSVITLGLRAHRKDLQELGLEQLTYPIYKIKRGGLATIHNPGQLVIYPILDLKKYNLSVKCFVSLLFQTTQKTLQDFGICSDIDLDKNPGVYTNIGKIAFCGLQIQNGITSHGLSININNDLTDFNKIQSCGVNHAQFDRVQNYSSDVTTIDFYKLWSRNFSIKNQLICN